MIIIERSEINEKYWNDCISGSNSDLIYGYSWYLDEICPNWKGIVVVGKNKYEACFPITWNKKWGIKYIYPPFFAQQLGLFSSNENYNVDKFLRIIRKEYRFAEFYLNHTNQGRSLRVKNNQILRLDKSYQELHSDYRSNHQRNIKRNKAKIRIEEGTAVLPIIELFRNDRGKNVKTLKGVHYKMFEKTCSVVQEKGKLLVLNAFNENNNLLVGAVFFIHQNRITFMFSGNSEEGKKRTALFILLDNLIKEYANTKYVLDFEGSNIAGVRRFYKGFGAVDEQYFFKKINNLRFPFNYLKK